MELTPEQFNLIVTKKELNDAKEELKKEMMTKDDKKELLSAIEGLTTEVKTSKQERTANQGAHDRMQGKIDDHEGRLSELELKAA